MATLLYGGFVCETEMTPIETMPGPQGRSVVGWVEMCGFNAMQCPVSEVLTKLREQETEFFLNFLGGITFFGIPYKAMAS